MMSNEAMQQQLQATQEQVQQLLQQLEAEREAANQVQTRLKAQLEQQSHYIRDLETQVTRLQHLVNTSPATTYRHLFDCNPQPMWVYDLETLRFLAVNDAAIVKYGYTRAEFLAMTIADIRPPGEVPRRLGKTTHEFFPPGIANAFQANDQWLVERGDVQQFEEIVRVDGEDRVYLSNKFLLRNEQGEAYAIGGMSTDITDLKEIETRLKRQLATIEAAVDGIAISSQDYTFLYLNQAHLDLFGYPDGEELMGQSWTILYSPEEQARLAQEVFPTLERDGAWSGEAIATRKDGTTFDQGLSLTLTEDGLVICVCEDISDRKQAELRTQQLLQELAGFKTALDQSAIVAVTDAQGVITDVNDRFCEVAGYSRQDLIGQTHRLVNSGYHSAYFFRDLWRTLASGQVWRGEICNRGKDGSRYWVDSTLVPFLDDRGRPERYLAIRFDISDRKRAEVELRHLSGRLTLALQAGAYGTWDWDLVNEAAWDERMYEIYGLQDLGRAATYQDWRDRVHPDDINWVEAQLQAAVRGEAPFNVEFRIWRTDGKLRWVQVISRTQYDVGGNPVRMVGINCDITHRKQQELALETYAREVEDLYDNAPCGYHTLDAAGCITRINNTELNWLNYARDRVVGQPITRFMTAASRLTFEERRSMLVQSGQVRGLEYEITLLGSDGGHLDVLVSEQLQKDDEGHIVGSRATVVDIRQRLKTEKILQRQFMQETLLREMTQNIRQSLNLPEILATVTQQVKQVLRCDRVIIFRLFADGHSRIEEEAVDRAFPALKGQSWENEVWSRDILEVYWQGKPRIVPDVMTDRWTSCLQDYSRQGQIQSKIVAPILSELFEPGNHRWVGPHQASKLWGILVVHACREQRVWQPSEAQLLQQIANQVSIAIQQAGLFAQLQAELVERQQAQKQLTESNQKLAIANQELARATRLKDEFLANMSHELRTPLNAILGMAEGLQEEVFGPLNHRQRRSLNTIERSGIHLLSLINDILDVAKIEAGQLQLDYTAVNVSQLCDSSLTFVSQQAHKKYLQLEMHIPPGLPDLYGDELRLRQVLINLLTNAVKFTPEAGCITISAAYTPLNPPPGTTHCEFVHPQGNPSTTVGILTLTVADTGIGISPENASKLFQPFVQVDSALNRQHEGTGLGLALVKRITELHGGKVELTSDVGLGSRFTLHLPVIPFPEGTAFELSPTPAPAAHTPSNPDTAPLILLAEDNEANINTTRAYLRAKGYRLIVATNGFEAVHLASTAAPDLILMDIQMPQLDGLEAIRQIRQNPALDLVPIVAFTALAMPDDRERCLTAGANEYASKPIRLKQLSKMIQTLLSTENSGQENTFR